MGLSSCRDKTFFFSSPERPDRFWDPTQPPIQWVPGVPSTGGAAEHTSPSIFEVRAIGVVSVRPLMSSCSVQRQLYVTSSVKRIEIMIKDPVYQPGNLRRVAIEGNNLFIQKSIRNK
jgi:hypothetical protein